MQSYVAIVHHEAGSAFGISFPDLPGCFAAADDETGLYAAAQTALSLYVDSLDALPRARPIEDIMVDPEIAADLREGALLISVPVITAERKTRVNLMVEPALLQAIDRTASTVGLSRSEFVSQTMGRHLRDELGAVFVGGTRKSAASAAARVMKSKTASKAEKSVAASALTQKGSDEKTGKKVASSAAKVLRSKTASKDAKSAAASALTQKRK